MSENTINPERPVPSEGISRRDFLKTVVKASVGVVGTLAVGGTVVKIVSELTKEKKISVPDRIDRTATEGTLGVNNTMQVTPKDYSNVAPKIVENGYVNVPLAVSSKDGQIRTVHYKISKGSFAGLDDYNAFLTFDGLVAGDTLLSPVNGIIEINQGNEGLSYFFLYTDPKGSSKGYMEKDDAVIIYSTTGLKPIIDFEKPINGSIRKEIKIGDPIGTLISSAKDERFGGQVKIRGSALGQLPTTIATTSDGKAINLVIQ
ncbi:MAG: hypothetical protein US55_C0061G0003 [Candidatus Levybacteria bacterium GW2011_GWC2_37_7]|nr:MAG: hypothetical protein US55_C0061G0003 [Candidatus Levybacteria bacterium GW2011_GWC2_37_7]